MKRRVEKKYVNQFLSGWCESCHEDHGGQRKLESARQRRVEAVMRRLARKRRKNLPLLRPFKFVFTVDMPQFVKVMSEISARTMTIGDALKIPNNGS